MPALTCHSAPLVSIVDDDPSVRRALHRLVEAACYTVETFASAEEFLDSMRWDRSACLILDVHLNGMNGLELKVRLAAMSSPIPVIFMTAHDDAETRERIDRSGAASYLVKPFGRVALLGAIRDALAPSGGGPGRTDGR
jgi:FixJ family two-component response regulator